jgi:hypothetical protein
VCTGLGVGLAGGAAGGELGGARDGDGAGAAELGAPARGAAATGL